MGRKAALLVLVAAGCGGRVDETVLPDAAVDEFAYLKKVVPVFQITVGKPIVADPEVAANLKVIEEENGPVTLDVPITIQIRGNSSSGFPQKPYGIELIQAQPLLGLPSETDFVLHSCYADKSCLRNALTYAIGREVARGTGGWAPRTRWVEVHVDGKYLGLYLLVEKIKRDKNRVALPAPALDESLGDISGSYIFSGEGSTPKMPPEREWPDPVIGGNYRWNYRSPAWRTISPAQKAYLQGAITDFERTLLAPNWRAVYRDKIDVPSWIDYALMQELGNNVDGYWKSVYFTKLPGWMGGRFRAGPIWDFDLAYGNVNYGTRYCVTTTMVGNNMQPHRRVWQDPDLVNEARCRWLELRRTGGPFDIVEIERKIDAFVTHIERAKARDQQQWKNIGRYVWPNNYIGSTHAEEVRFLKYWLRKRLPWVDARLKGACPSMPPPAAVEPVEVPPGVPESMPRPVTATQAPYYVPPDGPTSDPKLASWGCPAW